MSVLVTGSGGWTETYEAGTAIDATSTNGLLIVKDDDGNVVALVSPGEWLLAEVKVDPNHPEH